MKLKNEYSEVLKESGYNIETRGAIYFSSLLDEVRGLLMKGAKSDDVKRLLPRYYLEDYHFFFEVPKDEYFAELNDFNGKRVVLKKDKKVPVMGLEDSLIYFANMFNERENLTKEDANGRRIFLGDEFYQSSNSKDGQFQTRISQLQNKIKVNGVIDEKVYRRDDLEQLHSMALTKNDFADLILNDAEFAKDFAFTDFRKIFEIIDQIVKQ